MRSPVTSRAATSHRRICSFKANINSDGGDKNIFDPGNGYRDEYKKIWGVM